MLICIEGLTNSGKTTLCKGLAHKLSVVYINDILRTDVVSSNIARITNPVENIGKFNTKTELFLYLSMLSQKAYWIDCLKSKNRILLVDRFALSVFVQFCVNKDFDRNFVQDLVKFCSNEIIPDYTFFLDVNLDTIMDRTATSPFSRKDLSLPQQYSTMRDVYLNYIAEFSESYHIIKCGNGDASKKMTDKILSLIENL